MAAMWTSKLGNRFPKASIDSLDGEHHRILNQLRKQSANSRCAECGTVGTTWASVNIGAFLCVRCADVHRALGTHISKVKGCSGTYLWGPDEISRMQEMGNTKVNAMFGGDTGGARPSASASKEERLEICRKKYEQRLWAGRAVAGNPSQCSSKVTGEQLHPGAPASGQTATSGGTQLRSGAPVTGKAASVLASESSLLDDMFKVSSLPLRSDGVQAQRQQPHVAAFSLLDELFESDPAPTAAGNPQHGRAGIASQSQCADVSVLEELLRDDCIASRGTASVASTASAACVEKAVENAHKADGEQSSSQVLQAHRQQSSAIDFSLLDELFTRAPASQASAKSCHSIPAASAAKPIATSHGLDSSRVRQADFVMFDELFKDEGVALRDDASVASTASGTSQERAGGGEQREQSLAPAAAPAPRVQQIGADIWADFGSW